MNKEPLTTELNTLDKLVNKVPYKALDFLTVDLSPEDLENRLFGIDNKNIYGFDSYKMVGNKVTGYCTEITQNYRKNETSESNELTLKVLYGRDPKYSEYGDIIDLTVIFDISQNNFSLISVAERRLNIIREIENIDREDYEHRTAILGLISSILDDSEVLPDHITEGVKEARGDRGDVSYKDVVKKHKKAEKSQKKRKNSRLGNFIKRHVIASAEPEDLA